MAQVIAVTDAIKMALPQALTYMMSRPTTDQPLFGILTNGDDIVFVKLTTQPTPQYQLSRSFKIFNKNPKTLPFLRSSKSSKP